MSDLMNTNPIMAQNLPILDPTAVTNLLDLLGDMDSVREMIAEFEADTRQMLQEAGDALQKGDLVTTQRIAHTFKSTALSFGLLRFLETARILEAQAKAHQLAEAQATWQIANEEFSLGLEVLQKIES